EHGQRVVGMRNRSGVGLSGILRSLRQRGSVARNLAILATGSAGSYAIQLLTAPIVTRLFSPEEYGQYGIFVTLVASVATAGTLNYSSALVVAKSNSDFAYLLRLSFLLGGAVAVVSGLTLSIGGGRLLPLVGFTDIGAWRFFLGPIILVQI